MRPSEGSARRTTPTLPAAPRCCPQLTRLCVAADGRVKANFADNSILLLNAAGSSFVHLQPAAQGPPMSPPLAPQQQQPQQPQQQPDPSISRQLSEYALSRHAAQLRVALDFRNMHVDQPFLCAPLLRRAPAPPGLTLGFHIAELWWPRCARQALAEGLVQLLPDGRVAVSTADSSARIVLHHHGRRFAVSYPLLVEEGLTAEGQQAFRHVWHTQAFSLQAYPPRWRPAVHLLLEVAGQLAAEGAAHQGHITPGLAPAAATAGSTPWGETAGWPPSREQQRREAAAAAAAAAAAGTGAWDVHQQQQEQLEQDDSRQQLWHGPHSHRASAGAEHCHELLLPPPLTPDPQRARCTQLPVATSRWEEEWGGVNRAARPCQGIREGESRTGHGKSCGAGARDAQAACVFQDC